MKKTISLSLLFFILGVAARGAESVTVEQIIAQAKSDPRNAALVIEYAAEDNPKLLLELVAAAVRELPEQAAAIVGGLMKAVSKQQAAADQPPSPQQVARQTQAQQEILSTAIQARPERAADITTFALALFPAKSTAFIQTAVAAVPAAQRAEFIQTAVAAVPAAQRAEFIQTAVAAVPAAQRAEIAALATKVAVANPPSPSNVPAPLPAASAVFPTQPVRPDLVSPSS